MTDVTWRSGAIGAMKALVKPLGGVWIISGFEARRAWFFLDPAQFECVNDNRVKGAGND